MVLLKEQFEAAKKKYGLPQRSKKKKVEKQKELETGFLNTKKIRCDGCKQKFTYKYRWLDIDDNTHKAFTNVNFLELRRRALDKGLDWGIVEYNEASKTAKKVGLPLSDLK